MWQQLESGLSHLNICASKKQKEQLMLLLQQLIKWNKAYNLTAIKTEKEALTLHLLDSLSVVPFIKQSSLLDVGTGAGFPGLPLAIMLPQTSFVLLDSNSKKIRFIRQQIHTLQLKNVEAIHSRVEKFENRQFEGVISRAFASVNDMVGLTKPLLAKNGRWLAMKAQYTPEESEQIMGVAEQLARHELVIPGLHAKRCLIELVAIQETND